MSTPESRPSPRWSTTTKLVVALTLVAVVAGLLLYFQGIISSLVISVIIAYLLYPLVRVIHQHIKTPWRLTTTVVFILFVLVLIGLMVGAGIAIVQQLQSLVFLLQDFTADIPQIAEDVSAFLASYGMLSEAINVDMIANRLLETLQSVLGQAGVVVSSIATGAAVSFGKIVFTLAVAYFLLADVPRQSDQWVLQTIPEYNADIRRMGKELKRIWTTFFRGQIIIFVFAFVVYSILLSALGVRYAVVLAVMTGLARFVPYIGPWVTGTILALVTFLQPSNYFGLLSWQYAAMVLGITISVDFVFDNYVAPRFYGRTLGIHPAAVLVAAIVSSSFLGLVGIFLAAPVVATLKLLGLYVFRKMFDLDPWPEDELEIARIEFPWNQWGKTIWKNIRAWWTKFQENRRR